MRNELLLKLFFSRNVEPDVARRQVEEFRRQVTELARQGDETRSRLESNQQGSPDLPYWLLTLRFGEIQRAAVLTWCEEAVAALDRLASARTWGEEDDGRPTGRRQAPREQAKGRSKDMKRTPRPLDPTEHVASLSTPSSSRRPFLRGAALLAAGTLVPSG